MGILIVWNGMEVSIPWNPITLEFFQERIRRFLVQQTYRFEDKQNVTFHENLIDETARRLKLPSIPLHSRYFYS